MKLMTFYFALTLLSLSTPSLFAEKFTPKMKAKVIKYLEKICGDTWCESSELENLHFFQLNCHPTEPTCTVYFKTSPEKEMQSCEVHDVYRPVDFEQFKMREQINNCIGD